MERWVREHGSERLRKADELGLLHRCEGIYRDERLALERPGWAWSLILGHSEDDDILNPTLEQLRALEAARKVAPFAVLKSMKFNLHRRPIILDHFLGRVIELRLDDAQE